jgi:hypothetical protein
LYNPRWKTIHVGARECAAGEFFMIRLQLSKTASRGAIGGETYERA